MEVSQLIELMNAVSEAGLTDFCYEENGVSVKIKKHPEKKIVASAPIEMIAPSAVAAPAQIPAAAPTAKDSDAAEEIGGNTVKKSSGWNLLFCKCSGCSTVCTGGRYREKKVRYLESWKQ